jgi:hypothetical protein
MTKYQQYKTVDGEICTTGIMKDDMMCVSFNGGNEHQKYLEWLEEGNTPLPADE